MTSTRIPLALLATFCLTGCPDDGVLECQKADFELGTPAGETGAEDDGRVAAYLDGDLAYFEVAYTCAFPVDLDQDAIVEELSASAELTIRNNATGVTVSLSMAADPQSGTPNSPGEWTINYDPGDKTVRFTLFNELESGQKLYEGGDYTAVFSLGPNDVAEEIVASSMDLLILQAP